MSMQIGTGWLVVNDLGSNCQVKNITPAEAFILRKQFGVKVAGQAKPTNPLSHLSIEDKSVDRSNEVEYSRLAKKFGSKIVSEAFPGENPKLPETFAEYLGKEEDGKTAVKALPKEPEKGKEIEIPVIESLKSGDNGADLEAATNQAQVIADLQAQVKMLVEAGKAKTEEVKKEDPKKVEAPKP